MHPISVRCDRLAILLFTPVEGVSWVIPGSDSNQFLEPGIKPRFNLHSTGSAPQNHGIDEPLCHANLNVGFWESFRIAYAVKSLKREAAGAADDTNNISSAQLDKEEAQEYDRERACIREGCYSQANFVPKLVRQIANAWKAESGCR
ncbi:hypothetical protein BHE74_00036274 [Ensete ventricosum]|nr:hypothetical protein BHE74_00036274 [Ensete ventricosum]